MSMIYTDRWRIPAKNKTKKARDYLREEILSGDFDFISISNGSDTPISVRIISITDTDRILGIVCDTSFDRTLGYSVGDFIECEIKHILDFEYRLRWLDIECDAAERRRLQNEWC